MMRTFRGAIGRASQDSRWRAFGQYVIAFGLATSASGQNVITTLAGGPKVFVTGTRVDALTTSVAPSRIAIGPNDEIYFGDREANAVLRLNPNGTLTLVAGNGLVGFSGDGGPATSASLNQPVKRYIKGKNSIRRSRMDEFTLDEAVTV